MSTDRVVKQTITTVMDFFTVTRFAIITGMAVQYQQQKRRRRPGSTEVRLEDFDVATVFDLFETKRPQRAGYGTGAPSFTVFST